MQNLKQRIISYSVYLFYRVLSSTWRVRLTEDSSAVEKLKKGQPFVLAHWHGEILGLLHLLNHYNSVCIVSQSKDGELIAQAIEYFGCKTARGSSTRGGAGALRTILKLLKQNWRPTIAIDGPKGPFHIPKPGVIEIASLAQLPIYPLVCKVHSGLTFKKSWDQSRLPAPFARIDIRLGEPIHSETLKSQSMDANVAYLKNRMEETSAQFN